jgi:L-alanine-DL-glutamate epimerase-like enolase superfamily enzyme
MECHSFTDVQSAIQIGKRVEKYNIFCYEEPITPSPKLTKQVADAVSIPIASGERIYTRWGYAPYFENGSLALIQPDLGTSGGITEGKKICDMAYAYDVSVQAHVCASPLSVAAALQLEAAIPNFCIHEHHVVNRASDNRELCVHDYQPVDGYMTIPELPGIGNELSEYALKTAEKVTVSTARVFKMEKSGNN